MKRSESTAKLAAALAEFQAEIKAIPRNAENPYFHSTYTDLASIWDTIRAPLAKHGLSVIQGGEPTLDGTLVSLSTMLLHISGEWIEGTFSVPVRRVKDKETGETTEASPQSYCSTITYARRYGLCAILGIISESEDDDALGAEGRTTAPAYKADGTIAPKKKPPCKPSPVHPVETGKMKNAKKVFACPVCKAENTLYMGQKDGDWRFSCPADNCTYWWTEKEKSE